MDRRKIICLLVVFAAIGGTAFAQEDVEARCTLTYEESVDVEGPCSILEEGQIVRIKGTAEETGQVYIASIDNGKDEELLIGAGTFTVADGKLAKNEETKVVWPNGYVLTIELE
jgi:hypothetical protein